MAKRGKSNKSSAVQPAKKQSAAEKAKEAVVAPKPAAAENDLTQRLIAMNKKLSESKTCATFLPSDGFAVPPWAREVVGCPALIPWVTKTTSSELHEFAALRCDECYSSMSAAMRSGTYLLRMTALNAQQIFFVVVPGAPPFIIFKKIGVPVGFSISTRTSTIYHPALAQLRKQNDWAERIALASTRLLRIQGSQADMEELQKAASVQVHPKPSREGLVTGNIAFDDAILPLVDKKKFLILPLDNLVHGANAERSFTVRFNWEKAKFGDIWQRAVEWQERGYCVSFRFGALRVMAFETITIESIIRFEKEPLVKGVFTDIHRDRLARENKPRTGDDEEPVDEEAATSAPTSKSTITVSSVLPRSQSDWNALMTQIGTMVRSGQSWAQYKPNKVGMDLSTLAATLLGQGLLVSNGDTWFTV
jgi:hypothetical protein